MESRCAGYSGWRSAKVGAGGEGKVTGHKPSSVAEIVLYASVRARMRVYAHTLARARSSIYFRIRTVTRVILAEHEKQELFTAFCELSK